MSGKPIGKAAMTPTERQRKWRAKLRRQKIWGTNPDVAARRPTPRRSDLDFWPTPPDLAAALVQVVLPILPPGPIWEPAAGDGQLLDAGHLASAVLLQRADSGGAAGRAAAFNRAAMELTCCWRPVWIPGTAGGGRWWFSWFVWLAGHPGPPVNRRIRRADLRL